MNIKLTGTVIFFKNGYGFIKPDIGGNKDVFVHYKGIIGDGFRSLEAGQRVKFSFGNNFQGITAVEVEVLPECSAE